MHGSWYRYLYQCVFEKLHYVLKKCYTSFTVQRNVSDLFNIFGGSTTDEVPVSLNIQQ